MTGAVLSRDMTPDEFKQRYDDLKKIDPTLNHTKLAQRLDVDQPRIGKWLRGDVAISGYLWRALRDLERELIEEQRPKRRTRRPPSAGEGAE